MVGLPVLGIGGLFALPWLDRNPNIKARKRPVAMSVAAVLVVGMVFLTYQGMSSAPKDLAVTGVVQHPSYKKNVQPILQNSCVQCHSSIASYPGTLAKVSPNNPDNSSLYQHLTGSVPPQMPLGKDPLTKEQMQTVKNWIQDGAKNN